MSLCISSQTTDKCCGGTSPFPQALIYLIKDVGLTPRGRVNQLCNGTRGRGLLCYRTFLNSERVLVVSPEALSEVLVTKCYDFKKPDFLIAELRQLLGMGILLAEGDEHKKQRKALSPAFQYRHLRSLYGPMWAISNNLVAAIRDEVATSLRDLQSSSDSAVVDIAAWTSRATLDIIGAIGMGEEFGAIRDPGCLLHRTYQRLFQPSRGLIFLSVLRLLLPGWLVRRLPLRSNRELQEAAQTIRETCRNLIRQRTEMHPNTNSLLDGSKRDLLAVAASYGGFSEDGLIDQLMTFLAAGHETTATALTWAIYIVCTRPSIQMKLRQEIQSKLPRSQDTVSGDKHARGEDHGLFTLVDDRSSYLTAVCNETLRYFAPIPLTIREAIHDTQIQGTRIPAGTKMILAPRATNRDQSLWGDDAQMFDPKRWLRPQAGETEGGPGKERREPRGLPTSKYASLSFLHGPRSCIGQSFARAELAIVLSALVSNFEFSLDDERLMDANKINISRGVTAKPVGGMRVGVRLLDGEPGTGG